MTIQKQPLIIDGMNLLYRSYHGNEKLTNSKSFPTGAIYSFIRTVLGLQKKYKDFEPVFVFDKIPASALFNNEVPTHSFSPPALGDILSRKQISPDYKSNRSSMPDDLIPQCWPLIFILHNLGYAINIANGGIEGDDLIGTLVAQSKLRGLRPKVASGDKDMLALIDDSTNTTIYNFNDKKEYNEALLAEKYSIKPSQVADFLALKGDAIDNIIGVEKCGDVTAAKWLNTYETLNNIIANADDIKGVVGNNLRAALHRLPQNLMLSTLMTDLPVDYTACMKKPEPQYGIVKSIFEELEIKSFDSLLPQTDTPTP